MNPKTILFSRKKRLKILFTGLAVLLLGAIMLGIVLQADRVKIIYVLAFALIMMGALVITIVQLVKILGEQQAGLQLDKDGFIFNSTSIGKQIGKVKWQDIALFKAGSAHNTNQLFVQFKNPSKYIDNVSNQQIRQTLITYGLPLNDSELDISFHEMQTLVMQYYHEYHNE